MNVTLLIDAIVRHGGSAVFVDQGTGIEAFQRKGRVQRMRLVVGNGMREHPAGTGRGLEAARAPAAIEIQALQRRFADSRTGIRAGINNATPLPQHAHPAENREQFHNSRQGAFDNIETAALAIAGISINTRADHQLTLVGLTDITMHCVRHNDGMQYGFKRF